jgi:hypothetical protein
MTCCQTLPRSDLDVSGSNRRHLLQSPAQVPDGRKMPTAARRCCPLAPRHRHLFLSKTRSDPRAISVDRPETEGGERWRRTDRRKGEEKGVSAVPPPGHGGTLAPPPSSWAISGRPRCCFTKRTPLRVSRCQGPTKNHHHSPPLAWPVAGGGGRRSFLNGNVCGGLYGPDLSMHGKSFRF